MHTANREGRGSHRLSWAELGETRSRAAGSGERLRGAERLNSSELAVQRSDETR